MLALANFNFQLHYPLGLLRNPSLPIDLSPLNVLCPLHKIPPHGTHPIPRAHLLYLLPVPQPAIARAATEGLHGHGGQCAGLRRVCGEERSRDGPPLLSLAQLLIIYTPALPACLGHRKIGR